MFSILVMFNHQGKMCKNFVLTYGTSWSRPLWLCSKVCKYLHGWHSTITEHCQIHKSSTIAKRTTMSGFGLSSICCDNLFQTSVLGRNQWVDDLMLSWSSMHSGQIRSGLAIPINHHPEEKSFPMPLMPTGRLPLEFPISINPTIPQGSAGSCSSELFSAVFYLPQEAS
jgi:hypothetical protein